MSDRIAVMSDGLGRADRHARPRSTTGPRRRSSPASSARPTCCPAPSRRAPAGVATVAVAGGTVAVPDAPDCDRVGARDGATREGAGRPRQRRRTARRASPSRSTRSSSVAPRSTWASTTADGTRGGRPRRPTTARSTACDRATPRGRRWDRDGRVPRPRRRRSLRSPTRPARRARQHRPTEEPDHDRTPPRPSPAASSCPDGRCSAGWACSPAPASSARRCSPRAAATTTRRRRPGGGDVATRCGIENWTGYIDEETVGLFTEADRASTSSTREEFNDNNEYFAKIQADLADEAQRSGPTSSRPSTGWRPGSSTSAGWQELPLDDIPNAKNLVARPPEPGLGPDGQVLPAVAVGHGRHRLQHRRDRAGADEHGRPVRPGVQGQDRHAHRDARHRRASPCCSRASTWPTADHATTPSGPST